MSSYMCVYWKTSAMAVQIQQINNHKAGGNSRLLDVLFFIYFPHPFFPFVAMLKTHHMAISCCWE